MPVVFTGGEQATALSGASTRTRVVGDQGTARVEVPWSVRDTATARTVCRKQLRPVATTGAELLDAAFGEDFFEEG